MFVCLIGAMGGYYSFRCGEWENWLIYGHLIGYNGCWATLNFQ